MEIGRLFENVCCEVQQLGIVVDHEVGINGLKSWESDIEEELVFDYQ